MPSKMYFLARDLIRKFVETKINLLFDLFISESSSAVLNTTLEWELSSKVAYMTVLTCLRCL